MSGLQDYVTSDRIDGYYYDFTLSFQYGDKKRIKQDIDNMITSAYQTGENRKMLEMQEKITKLDKIISGLQVNSKKNHDRGYGINRYQGD